RVGRGNEEGSQQDHTDYCGNRTTREGLQQVKQLCLSGLTGNGLTVLLQVDCGAAENCEPDGGNTSRNQHDAKAEFANAAAARNTSQEHPHECGQRNPPCPVADGPARQPHASGAVSGLSAATNHCIEVS